MHLSPVSPDDVQDQLTRVLASATFRGAERSRSLFRFIVEETLQGRSERLKDYTLGSEALGRGEQFDPRTDPIARVEASRLRSRLDVYYATEGLADPVRISLPKGGYVPLFQWRVPAPAPAASPDHTVATATAPPARRQWPSGVVLGAAVLAVTAAVAGWIGRWLSYELPAESQLELTTPPTADPVSLALSPDGRALAFVASSEGRSRLWIRRFDSPAPRELPGTDNASLPFWAPDGNSLGYFADGELKRIELATGLVRMISRALVPAGATWNREGLILHPVVPDGPLYRTSEAGPTSTAFTRLAPGQTGHRGPFFLPDGRHFLFYAAGSRDVRGVYVGDLGNTDVRRLVEADAPAVFAPPDHVLYVKNATLLGHRVDPATLTLVGQPVSLADGITTAEPMGGMAALSAASGTIAYRTGFPAGKRQFVWFDRRGHELSRIGSPEPTGPSYGSLSPNGRRLAVQRSADGNTDILLIDTERGTPSHLTTGPQADIAPQWSPTGDRLVYSSLKGGVFQIFEKVFDDTPPRLLLETPDHKQVTDWSRDGKYLLYRTVMGTSDHDMDIWALPLEGNRQPLAVVRTPFQERDAVLSPDGRWIAYHSNLSGRHEVYVRPFPPPGEAVAISKNGGVQAQWRFADRGLELFYLTLDGQLVAVPMKSGPDGRSLEPGPAEPLFQTKVGTVQGVALHSYLVAPDGQRFLIDTIVEEPAPPVSIILNWRGRGSATPR